MASLKRSYTKTTLLDLSAKIMDQLEETDLFQQASCIALYHAIPGEVQTAGLIEKWYRKKRLLLPLIKGNDLQLLLYAGKESLKTGVFGILEPSEDCEAVPESEIDLIIVPGVAFDRQHNRLGRGKGFYDRLLSTLDVPKIGICYDFQLKDQIPAEPFDRKMDLIITEKKYCDSDLIRLQQLHNLSIRLGSYLRCDAILHDFQDKSHHGYIVSKADHRKKTFRYQVERQNKIA